MFKKTLLFLAVLFVMAIASTPAHAQGSSCWDCYGAGWCMQGMPEGWAGCGHVTIHCPGNPFCSPGENGNYTVCFMKPPYQYCVYGENKNKDPKIQNVQWRQPGIDTNKVIPWITNDNLGPDVGKYSLFTGMDQVVKEFQLLELKNGINAPAAMIRFVGNIKQVTELSTEETADAEGVVHVIQHIRTFQAEANPNAKNEGDEGFVRSHDMILGKVGTMVEELTLSDSVWTLVNKKGKVAGKVMPYFVPPTKAEAEASCHQKHS